MRLLLDEHYAPALARALRSRGHDVVAASERVDLVGLSDPDLLARATAERRAIVTEDVVGFRGAAARAALAGEARFGVVFVNSRRFPRDRARSAALVEALDRLLRSMPGDADLVASGGELWLRPPAR